MNDESHDLTRLLMAWREGSEGALSRLMPLVYQELRKIAGILLSRERRGHTLETTALVHEAYLMLADLGGIPWRDRVHFYAMSARIMRRVLINHARRQGRTKRGGGLQQLSLDELRDRPESRAPDLLALDQALRELADLDPQQMELVEMRFFGGLNREQLAEALGISSATVTRRWRMARAWLIRYLSSESAEESLP